METSEDQLNKAKEWPCLFFYLSSLAIPVNQYASITLLMIWQKQLPHKNQHTSLSKTHNWQVRWLNCYFRNGLCYPARNCFHGTHRLFRHYFNLLPAWINGQVIAAYGVTQAKTRYDESVSLFMCLVVNRILLCVLPLHWEIKLHLNHGLDNQ